MKNLTFIVLSALALAGCEPEADLVLSPDGDVPTLAAALEKARELRRTGAVPPGRAVEVWVAPGRYPVAETVTFGPEDSNIRFTGAPGAETVFDGGRAIGPFAEAGDGTWTADVPAGFVFDQLWVNGRRAVRASEPDGAFFYMREQDYAQPKGTFFADVGDVAALAKLPADELARVVVAYWQSWDMGYTELKTVDFASGRVETGRSSGRDLFFWDRTCPRYRLENYRGALDAPGEWFLDAKASKLRYMPRPGETLAGTTAFAPVVETIVRFAGEAGRPVKGVRFANLAFEHAGLAMSGRDWPNAQAVSNNRRAAVMGEFAEDVAFERCRIAHAAVHGAWFGLGCHRIRIVHALAEDFGAGGVYFGTTSIPKDRSLVASHLELSDSVVRRGGRTFEGAIGVWLGHAHDCSVVHNEIADFRYTGVSLGWTWGYRETVNHDNHVDFNHIHHIGQGRLADMGGVYTLGHSPRTTVCRNWIHDVNGYRDNGSPAWGLYTDEGSQGELLASNLVERCRSGAIHQHYGKENVYANNILATFDEFGVWRSRAEDHVTIRVLNNVFWWTNAAARAYRAMPFGVPKDMPVDGNVYWCAGGEAISNAFNFTGWENWRQGGMDASGALADPLFADPANGDWTLKPGSPALAAGFRPFDWTEAGVLKADPAWRKLAATRTWDEFADAAPAPRYVRDHARIDFERLRVGPIVGAMGPLAPFTESFGKPGAVEVVADAAEGRRAIRFNDSPDLPHAFQPHVCLKCVITNGEARIRFAYKGEKIGNMLFELRDYGVEGRPYVTGALVHFAQGAVKAGGRKVCDLADGVWADVEVRMTVGGPTAGRWSCRVTPRGGRPAEATFEKPHDQAFRELTWVGFISSGKKVSSWLLDDFRLEHLK